MLPRVWLYTVPNHLLVPLQSTCIVCPPPRHLPSSSAPLAVVCLHSLPLHLRHLLPVVSPCHRPRCHCPSPWVVMWLLAPAPPCEQMLVVVGGGCWAVITVVSSPRCLTTRPPRKLGPAAVVVSPRPPWLSSFHPPPTSRAVAREVGGG